MNKQYINKLKVLHTDIGLTSLPYKESWRARLCECIHYFESLQKELEKEKTLKAVNHGCWKAVCEELAAVKAENERLRSMIDLKKIVKNS